MLFAFCILFGFKLLSSKAIDLNCRDKTLDDCDFGHLDLFETAKLSDAETCQLFCSQIYTGKCKSFIFDERDSVCQMFATDISEFEANCKVFGHPSNVQSLGDCNEEIDECLVSFGSLPTILLELNFLILEICEWLLPF